MGFDFSKLNGRIAEKFKSHKALAEHISMAPSALSNRLGGKVQFRPDEIMAICAPECLDIPGEDIGTYFFTPKVLFLEPTPQA